MWAYVTVTESNERKVHIVEHDVDEDRRIMIVLHKMFTEGDRAKAIEVYNVARNESASVLIDQLERDGVQPEGKDQPQWPPI